MGPCQSWVGTAAVSVCSVMCCCRAGATAAQGVPCTAESPQQGAAAERHAGPHLLLQGPNPLLLRGLQARDGVGCRKAVLAGSHDALCRLAQHLLPRHGVDQAISQLKDDGLGIPAAGRVPTRV